LDKFELYNKGVTADEFPHRLKAVVPFAANAHGEGTIWYYADIKQAELFIDFAKKFRKEDLKYTLIEDKKNEVLAV
jgi:hypothetical protein